MAHCLDGSHEVGPGLLVAGVGFDAAPLLPGQLVAWLLGLSGRFRRTLCIWMEERERSQQPMKTVLTVPAAITHHIHNNGGDNVWQ